MLKIFTVFCFLNIHYFFFCHSCVRIKCKINKILCTIKVQTHMSLSHTDSAPSIAELFFTIYKIIRLNEFFWFFLSFKPKRLMVKSTAWFSVFSNYFSIFFNRRNVWQVMPFSVDLIHYFSIQFFHLKKKMDFSIFNFVNLWVKALVALFLFFF